VPARHSRRAVLAAGGALLGAGIVGCRLRRPTGAASLRVANLTSEPQRLTVRIRRGDELVWRLRAALPARDSNDAPTAEATHALQSVAQGEQYRVVVAVDGFERESRSQVTIDCAAVGEPDDLVVVRLLPNAGAPYADIRERDCGSSS
jgi:hypothetical protein